MTVIDLDAAERHRVVAGSFAAVAGRITDWDAPSPVPGWTARDVVGHLLEWFPGFLAAGTGITLPAGASVEDDPVQAWRAQQAAVQDLLDRPDVADRVLSNPHVGDVALPEAVDRFYTTDVFLHTWDLARAAGERPDLDPQFCAHLLAGMVEVEEVMRASGQYGPAVPVAPTASVQERLAAFIGRDPQWKP